MPAIIGAAIAVGLAIIAAASGLRTVLEHERGLILRLGRRGRILAPGLHVILPFGIDRLVRVDLRSTVLRLPPHEVMTADGVPVTVTAAIHLQVVNPLLAVTRVVDHRASCVQVAHAAVADVTSRQSLRTLITEQATVRDQLTRFVEERAEPWGIQVTAVDVKDIELPDALRHAMESHITAAAEERTQRTAAAAELEAARRLVEAARALAEQPYAVQLRYLQALTEMSDSNRTVVVVPLPVDLVQPFVDLQGRPTVTRRRRVAQAKPRDNGEAAAEHAAPGA